MFGKIASEALGLSEVGKVISPADYDKVESDDYVLHEDGERIFFLIKSKTDEYCFTDKALIHVDGSSATSKKRSLKRYTYAHNPISDVSMETAGTVDLDVEIKFTIGNKELSVDVHKRFIEEIKDLYKALLCIAEMTHENRVLHEHAHSSVKLTSETLGRSRLGEGAVVDVFNDINQAAFTWLKEADEKFFVKDFGEVFERYISSDLHSEVPASA